MAKRLTERQRKSKRASKVKARQRWQYALWCKCRSLALLIVTASLCAAGYFIYNGQAQQMASDTRDTIHQRIAQSGLAVEKIHLTGRKRTGMAEVRAAMEFEIGDSMLSVDLDALKTRMEGIPTVKHAAVSRMFPNEISISLMEREPVAVWQHQGELKLIDELGSIMTDLNLHQYQGLPLLVGEGAHQQVGEVLDMLKHHPNLANHVRSAIRISKRRWDLRLSDGVTVKLPEQHFMQAWDQLADLHKQEQLLHRHIEAIDLRNEERMYITLPAGKSSSPALILTKDT